MTSTTTATATNYQELPDGFYTVVYAKANAHRTLKVETQTEGKWAGSTFVGYLDGTDNEKNYRTFGFLNKRTGQVSFFNKFRASEPPERLTRIQRAVDIIFRQPDETGLAYALRSSRCCRCNRTLTVPASINNGLGPECAKIRASERQARQDSGLALALQGNAPTTISPAIKRPGYYGTPCPIIGI